MAERCYYTYTIPIDEQGQPLIIHRSERFITCHAFDKKGENVVLKIATDDYFADKEEITKAYERARIALDFSQKTDCDDCCKVYDVELNNEDFYIAMQYVKGPLLSSILDDIDVVENSSDLEVLEAYLQTACDRLSNAGVKQAALCAQNISLLQESDGIVLLNYTAHPSDEIPNIEQPAKEFVNQIRAARTKAHNQLLAAQQQAQIRKQRIKKCYWLAGILAAAACVVLYVMMATSVPQQIAAKWKYDTIEPCHDFFRVKLGDRYGVLSPAYEEIVPVEYDKVEIDARHPTSFIIFKNNCRGVYYTTTMTEGIRPQYDSVIWVKNEVYRVFQNGASLYADAAQSRYLYHPSDYLVYKSGKLYGYRDAFGNTLIHPQFDEANPFLKTIYFAAASKSGKWGIINQKGKFVIEPKYEQIRPHAEVVAAKKSGKWGYVSMDDKPLCDFIYSKVAYWGQEIADAGRVYMGDKSILLSRNGKYLYQDKDMVISNTNGTCCVKDLFGHILFYSSKVSMIYDYSCGRARVKVDGVFIDDYGYIDYWGNVVIPIKYSEASDFKNDKATVAEGNVFRDRMEIDLNGRIIRDL